MKTIQVGIIGCGVIAPTHVKSYLGLENVRIRAVCDLVAEKARKIAELAGGARVETDYHNLLNDPEIDCVSVCTDHASHSRIVVDALDAKKNVVCEKCLSAHPALVDDMLAAHRRNPEVVFSGIFQHRYEPVNRELKKLFEEGAFGRPLTFSMYCNCFRGEQYYNADAWRGTRACEGGSVLINQAIHYLDLMTYICGPVDSLVAACTNLTHRGVIDTEDTAAFTLRFANGMLGSVAATCSSEGDPWRHGFTLTGTKGTIEYLNLKPTAILFADPAEAAKVRRRLDDCSIESAMSVAKSYYGGGHPGQIADFVDAVRNHHAVLATGESAAETARMVFACYESSRTGSWVHLR